MHTITRRCYNVAVIIVIRPPTLHIVFGEKREAGGGGDKAKDRKRKKNRSGRDTAAAITAASTVSAVRYRDARLADALRC